MSAWTEIAIYASVIILLCSMCILFGYELGKRWPEKKPDPESQTLVVERTDDGWETIATWIEDPDGTRHTATPEQVDNFMKLWDAEVEKARGSFAND